MHKSKLLIDRRAAMKVVGGAAVTGLAVRSFPMPAIAQGAPLRVGFMLPYTGTYASLAKNIDNAFRQYVAEKGDKITVPGYLTFEKSSRAARTGRNPQTGAEIQIKASNSVKIKAGSKLKAAAN